MDANGEHILSTAINNKKENLIDMLSYWEKTQLLDYDLIVVGGGITGIFCALSYREKHPNARIAILEKGLFSSGASTKNAGFACFGSLTELMDDATKMDQDSMLKILELRVKGLALLRKTVGDKALDYKAYGGFELFFEENPRALDFMSHYNALLRPIFNEDVYHLRSNRIKSFGFDTGKVNHLIENSFEAQINTGMMMRALRTQLNEAHIFFFSHTEVTHFDADQKTVFIKSNEETIVFRYSKLAICNNAFAKQFFHDIEMNPGRGLVLATAPIEGLKIKGTFHYDEGYYYFRNIGNRLIFGGGRNVDFKTETTTTFGVNESIKEKLIHDLISFILPNSAYTLDESWSGIMAFGKNKTPLVKKMGDHCAVGVRLGGMGIAIGSKIGRDTAALLMD